MQNKPSSHRWPLSGAAVAQISEAMRIQGNQVHCGAQYDAPGYPSITWQQSTLFPIHDLADRFGA